MLIDSNILVYAFNTASPKSLAARHFIQTFSGKFFLAHQNVMETIRIVTHPKHPHPMSALEATSLVGEVVANARVISPNYDSLSLAIELVIKHKLTGAKVFDAYLVATMISNEIYEIATDNERDFRKYRLIKVINPFKINWQKVD